MVISTYLEDKTMGRNKKYGNIILKDGDREILEKIARSQTAEYRKVQRAKIILYSTDGMSNSEIAQTIGVHPNTVANFVNKYIAAGLEYILFLPHFSPGLPAPPPLFCSQHYCIYQQDFVDRTLI